MSALSKINPSTVNPFRLFARWFSQARRSQKFPYPETMCLSTFSPRRGPSGRMVLLKLFDDRGFVFYTNLNSPKSLDLRSSRQAALTFYWDPPGRQVRIVGKATQISDEEADAYFQLRDRMSRLGAWASKQSAPLRSRTQLLREVSRFSRKFRGRTVPRPPFWSGFRVIPERMEFWERRAFRLNDRLLFGRVGKNRWKVSRLHP